MICAEGTGWVDHALEAPLNAEPYRGRKICRCPTWSRKCWKRMVFGILRRTTFTFSYFRILNTVLAVFEKKDLNVGASKCHGVELVGICCAMNPILSTWNIFLCWGLIDETILAARKTGEFAKKKHNGIKRIPSRSRPHGGLRRPRIQPRLSLIEELFGISF